MVKESILDVAIKAAQGASILIQSSSKSSRIADYKGRTDLVTKTDKESEELICSFIKESFPKHGILAEESVTWNPDAEFLWIIDPLDGTTNFVHDYPSFGVSIAVMQNNKPIVGCVIELPANNTYTAISGQGAHCNNKPISVSQINELEKALYVTGFGYKHGELWEQNMVLFKKFTDIGQGVRRLGAAAVDLCHVASGKVDGFWEFNLHPWDTAAGILIVEEAGGKVSKMDGSPYSIYDNEILATNGVIHPYMSEQITK